MTAPDRTPAIRGGIALGLAVVVLQLVSVGAGLDAVFPLLATAVEIAALAAVLAATRDRAFAHQVVNGLVTTAVSLPFVAIGFAVTVLVVFPTALQDAAGGPVTTSEIVTAGGAGLVGTAITGGVVSPLLAAVLRNR